MRAPLLGATAGLLLGVVALRASGSPALWLPDVAVGVAWGAAAAWALPRNRPFAVLAATVALTWYAADVWPSTGFWHRAPLVAILLALPRWWPTTRTAGLVLVLASVASVLGGPWTSPLGALALSGAVVGALVVERRPTRGRRRHQRTVNLRIGCVLAVTFTAAPVVGLVAEAMWDLPVLIVYEVVLVVTAVVLARSLRATSATEATDLVIELGQSGSGTLVENLRRSLRDPDLQVWFLDEPPGEPASGRTWTRVVAAGRPIAIIDHDIELLADPALLAAVDSAARLTSINALLQAKTAAQLEELTSSRRRLVTSVARERARVRREIESGVGTRIDRLVAELADERDPHLRQAAALLSATADDLRGLTLGLSPSGSAESLPRALRELAVACPVPTTVTAVDAPLDDGIRSALYLTCAEALTNVAKHAAASSVQIVARPGSDGMFELEVVDDGVGGATCTAGSGLAGVHERIASVSGRVELTSPQGSGTRLVVRVPVGHPS